MKKGKKGMNKVILSLLAVYFMVGLYFAWEIGSQIKTEVGIANMAIIVGGWPMMFLQQSIS